MFPIETFPHLLAGFRSKNPDFKKILPELALFFDELLYFGNNFPLEEFKQEPYGKFVDISSEVFDESLKVSYPKDKELDDYKVAIGDEPGTEGGEYGYRGFRGLLNFAKENRLGLYVFPGYREGYIKFCVKYEPEYLPRLKESFLLCSILENIFLEEIPAFDHIKAKDDISKFKEYKQDFQQGILGFLNAFKGSYRVSKEQKKYLKQNIAFEEKRLLDFLQLENLRKFNVSKTVLDVIGEGISLFIPMPLGWLINIGNELDDLQEFKKANLNFPLSLIILKKITNVGEPEGSISCAVCAISPFEIEQLSDVKAEELMHNKEMCIEHMVARLDLHKRFGLTGKACLNQMKRLGHSSLWMNPK